jgi:hypothetical protein
MESRQYIICAARGDRWRVAKITAARGLPFKFVREIHEGGFVETVGKVELEHKRAVAIWFKDSAGGAGDRDGTLLAYAVTTDARELARQAARAARVEAAERAIALRACRRPSRRKAPAAHTDDHAGKLAADKAASRSRSRRRRARAQHGAKAPVPGADPDVVSLTTDKAADRTRSRRRARANARTPIAGATELLPADETAIPSPAGTGQAG